MFNYFSSKNLKAQILFTLIYYIEIVISIVLTEEVEEKIFPFFAKILKCKNERIQKLALSRLQLVFNKIQSDENVKKVFEMLMDLIESKSEGLIYLSLKFIEDNLNRFDKGLLFNDLMVKLEGFIKHSRRYENFINDLIFELVFKLYKKEEKEDSNNVYKYTKLFLMILGESNISRPCFSRCFNVVNLMISKLKKRETDLFEENFTNLEAEYAFKSVHSGFEQMEIQSPDLLIMIGQKPKKASVSVKDIREGNIKPVFKKKESGDVNWPEMINTGKESKVTIKKEDMQYFDDFSLPEQNKVKKESVDFLGDDSKNDEKPVDSYKHLAKTKVLNLNTKKEQKSVNKKDLYFGNNSDSDRKSVV